MRSLIPWVRDRRSLVPSSQNTDETPPLLTLQRQVNRVFDEIWRDFDGPLAAQSGWAPRWPNIDISASDMEMKVIADLPGLTEKDVEVTLRDGVLMLKGDKRTEQNDSHYREIWEGHFERSIDVGDVDPEKVRAEFKNGQLIITMEKRPEAQSRVKRIPIDNR